MWHLMTLNLQFGYVRTTVRTQFACENRIVKLFFTEYNFLSWASTFVPESSDKMQSQRQHLCQFWWPSLDFAVELLEWKRAQTHDGFTDLNSDDSTTNGVRKYCTGALLALCFNFLLELLWFWSWSYSSLRPVNVQRLVAVRAGKLSR